MRVTHVISGLESGGAEAFLARLAPAMAPEVRSTVVSLRDAGSVGGTLGAAGIPVHTVGMRRGRPDPRWLIRTALELRRSEPDLVQTWLYHGDLIGGIAGRFLRRPVIWNVRQTLVRAGAQPHARLIQTCARLSRVVPTAIVAVSAAARDDHVAAGYDAARFRVISNGFDTERFHPQPEAGRSVRAELGVGDEAALIGLVARDDPQKDHDTAFAAFAELRKHHPDARLALVGRGMEPSNRALMARIQTAGVADRCHLLGERTDLPRLQAAWDIALSSSSYGEGLSNAIGEAMAAGTPAVVTRIGATAQMVGETGRGVEPGRPDLLARELAAILDLDPDQRLSLGERSRRRIAEHYPLRGAAEAYVALYERILSS